MYTDWEVSSAEFTGGVDQLAEEPGVGRLIPHCTSWDMRQPRTGSFGQGVPSWSTTKKKGMVNTVGCLVSREPQKE